MDEAEHDIKNYSDRGHYVICRSEAETFTFKDIRNV